VKKIKSVCLSDRDLNKKNGGMRKIVVEHQGTKWKKGGCLGKSGGERFVVVGGRRMRKEKEALWGNYL